MLNQILTFPVTGSGVLSATEQQVIQDQSVLFGTTGPNNADISLTALATPSNTVITNGGTAGSTAYSYVVADTSAVGQAPAGAASTSTGASTLNGTNFNIITFSTIPGHIYNVYRSASSGTPSGTGLIATVTATLPTLTSPGGQVQAVVNDTGLTASLNVPTVNTTGCLAVPGPIFGAGVALSAFSSQTVTTSAAATWTVANMCQNQLIRAGATGSAVSDVTPTAAALVAAFPGVKAGQGFKFWFKNTTGFNVSVTAGTGVTVTGTAAVASVTTAELGVSFLNVTPGSESVTVFRGPSAAY